MIPRCIQAKDILAAMRQIDQEGVPPTRRSRKFHVRSRETGNKLYPPKYVISLAHKLAVGTEWPSAEFSGGIEANCFLQSLGFEIVSCRLRALGERKRNTPCGWIAVVVLQSSGDYDKESRLNVLERACEAVAEHTQGDGVVLFPAGWFSTGRRQARSLYPWLEERVPAILRRRGRTLIACVGVDGRIRPSDDVPRDQIAVAIGSKGIVALGRKFFPTSAESDYTEIAPEPCAGEDGRERIFELGGVRYFLCMCYDVFGVRKMAVPNPGVQVILDLAHGFWPKGQGSSGEVYFARDGFAGAAREWSCPVFGTGVFFDRSIPPAWPSGVCWNQGDKSTQKWCYDDNPLRPVDERRIEVPEGLALVRFYRIL